MKVKHKIVDIVTIAAVLAFMLFVVRSCGR